MKWGIRAKLAVGALLALLPVVAVFGVGSQNLLVSSLHSQMTEMRAYLLLEARGTINRNDGILATLIDDRLAELADRASVMASLPSFQAGPATAAGSRQLASLRLADGRAVDIITVIDPAGRAWAGDGRTARLLGSNSLGHSVRQALAGTPTRGVEVLPMALLGAGRHVHGQSLPQYAAVTERTHTGRALGPVPGALALVAMAPMRSQGRVRGVVLAADVLNHDLELLRRYRHMTGSSASFTLGGVRVASNMAPAQFPEGSRLPAHVLPELLGSGRFTIEDPASDRAWSYRPLRNGVGLMVGVAEAETSLFAMSQAQEQLETAGQQVSRAAASTLIVRLLGAAIMAMLLAGIAAIIVARPIRVLRQAVRRVAQGEFEQAQHLNLNTGDEIEQLARDFAEMAKQLQDAQEQERMALVGEMASSIIHDLRNPLTTIQGFAPLLADPNTTPEEKKEFLQAIDDESRRISIMLADLLEFSRGRQALQKEPQALDDFVQKAADLISLDLQMTGIHTQVSLHSRAQVLLDSNRMERVLTNLAGNAREVMPQGGTLWIETSAVGKLAFITVRDSGPGVPPEAREKLFEPFFTHGKANGTGLGLAICRQIVTAHGGAINLEQNDGQGATFVISLPIVG